MHPISITIIILCSCAAISAAAQRVEYLPGFQGPLPFYLETGYVGVDTNEDVQLFYYFIQSESNPKNDPLMLWISGGPGCSSLSGLLYEIGPIGFEAMHYNGSLPALILRRNSWTKMASIIFLDIPVGTGYSYARTTSASYSTDIQYSEHAHAFMRKAFSKMIPRIGILSYIWLQGHPEFISNSFYVGGDSYSGNPIPIITQLISNGNAAGINPYINLKGYVLGNPLTFPQESNIRIQFANGMGLISDELYESLFHNCHGEYRSEYIKPNNKECLQDLELYQECMDGIQLSHILEPYCGEFDAPIKLPSFNERNHVSAFYCRADRRRLAYYWSNDATVRESLHIHMGSKGDWERCSSDLNFTITVNDVRLYHLNLSKKGYRSLIYSGDHDMVVPHQSTQAWIKDLKYYVVEKWRSWKLHGQIAGYTESYSNMMTYATVKGGGHAAPEYKPEECFAMFKRWVSHQPL